MRAYDPVSVRETLTGPCGYRHSLAMDFEDSKSKRALGHAAGFFVSTAAECFLVGLDEPAQALLLKAHDWLEASLTLDDAPADRPEDVAGYRALRYGSLALCRWLRWARHDQESLRRYVECKDAFLARSRAGRNRVEISLSLAGYLDAGAFERVLALGERLRLAPASLKAIHSEGAMACALARQALTGPYAPLELQAALQAFLQRSMNGWLVNGWARTAAHWVKIAYWNGHEQDLTPRQTLLKCYEFLPGRLPPDASERLRR